MRKSSLMLHTGARSATRDQVAVVPTPARTQSWVPIPHARLLDGVQGCLERAGLAVVSEAHGLTRDGTRYFGLLQVAHADTDGDFGLVVCLRNSQTSVSPATISMNSATATPTT